MSRCYLNKSQFICHIKRWRLSWQVTLADNSADHFCTGCHVTGVYSVSASAGKITSQFQEKYEILLCLTLQNSLSDSWCLTSISGRVQCHTPAGRQGGTLRGFNEPSTFIYGSTNSQLTIKGHRQLFYGLDFQRRCLGVKCLQLSALHWRFIYSNCLAGIANIELRRLMSPGSHSLSW